MSWFFQPPNAKCFLPTEKRAFMETNQLEKMEEEVLFGVFSIFRYFILGKKRAPKTERAEAKQFKQWKSKYETILRSLPWEMIIRIYVNPSNVAILAQRKREELVFGIVKFIHKQETDLEITHRNSPRH